MSDVEVYWQAIRKKTPKPLPEFKDLNINHQHMIIQSINLLLAVIDSASDDLAR
jgi:hypothetical protein